MPIYQIDIEKKAVAGASTGEYWTNRYLVLATDLAAAVTEGSYITGIEQAFHSPSALFTKRSVRDLNPATDIWATTPINTLGTYGGGGGGELLPAMLVVRVDFAAATGRPSRKFYHTMWGEGFQANGTWGSSPLTDVNSNMALLFAGTPAAPLCGPQGELLLGGVALPTVTVHQFRRGSRRKLQPILP